MKRTILILVGLLIITALVVVGVRFWGSPNNSNPQSDQQKDQQQDAPQDEVDLKNNISISSPESAEKISSPVTIKGKAKGPWYFEGSFPVTVYDVEHNKLGEGVAEAQGKWTTEDFVPFQAEIEFDAPTSTDSGMIVLEKSNPSGKPSKSQKRVIAVKF